MPRYRITTARADDVAAFVEDAASPDLLSAKYAALGHTVIRITPEGWRWAFDLLNKEIEFRPALALRDIALLVSQWASMLQAGLPLKDVLALTSKSYESRRATSILQNVHDDVRAGSTFNAALARHPACFSREIIALVRAGETSGALPDVMRMLAESLSRRIAISDQIRSALIYPAFLSLTATGAIVVLLVVVVPSLETMLGEHRHRAPLVVNWLLSISHTLRSYWMPVLVASLTTLALIWAFLRVGRFRERVSTTLLRVPFIGRHIRERDVARFMGSLSALVEGGVNMSRAMELATDTVQNIGVRRDLVTARTRVIEGASLVSTLTDFPEDARALVQMGETTGRLAAGLSQGARLVEERARRRIERASSMLGPGLTLFFGLVCGTIVYAMLTAILSVNEIAF